jgi:hypothetical protein
MPITKADEVVGLVHKTKAPLHFAFSLFGKNPTLFVSKTESPKMVREKLAAAAREAKMPLNHPLLVFGDVEKVGTGLKFVLLNDKIPTGLGKQLRRFFILNKRRFKIAIADATGTVEDVADDEDDDVAINVSSGPEIVQAEPVDTTLVGKAEEDVGLKFDQIKAKYKKQAEEMVKWYKDNKSQVDSLLPSDAVLVRQLLKEGGVAWNNGKDGQYDIAFRSLSKAREYYENTGAENLKKFAELKGEVETYIRTSGIAPKDHADVVAVATEARNAGGVLTDAQNRALSLDKSGRLREIQADSQKLMQKFLSRDDVDAVQAAFDDLQDEVAAAVEIGDRQRERDDQRRRVETELKGKVDAKVAGLQKQLQDESYAKAVGKVSKMIAGGKSPAEALASLAEKDFSPSEEGEDADLIARYRQDLQTEFFRLVEQRHAAFLNGAAYKKANAGENVLVADVVEARLATMARTITSAFVKVCAGASGEKALSDAYKWAAAAHEGELTAFTAAFEGQSAEELQTEIAQYDSFRDANRLWQRNLTELDGLVQRASVADKDRAGQFRARLKGVREAFSALNLLSVTDYAATASKLEEFGAPAGAYAQLKQEAEAAIETKRQEAEAKKADFTGNATAVADTLAKLKSKAKGVFSDDTDSLRVLKLFEKAVDGLPAWEEISDDPKAAAFYAKKALDLKEQIERIGNEIAGTAGGPNAPDGPIKRQKALIADIEGTLKKIAKADTKGWYADSYKKDFEKILKGKGGEEEGGEDGGGGFADHHAYIASLTEFKDKLEELTPKIEGTFAFRIEAKARLEKVEKTMSDLQEAIAKRKEYFDNIDPDQAKAMRDTNTFSKSVYRGKQGTLFKTLTEERATRVDPKALLDNDLPGRWDHRCTELETWLGQVWDKTNKALVPAGKDLLTADVTAGGETLKKKKDLSDRSETLANAIDARKGDIDAVLGTGEYDILVKRIESIDTVIKSDLEAAEKQLKALEDEWKGRKDALDGGKITAGPAVLAASWRKAHKQMIDGIDPLFDAVAKTLPNVPRADEAAKAAAQRVTEHLSRLFHKSAFDLCVELMNPDGDRQRKRETKEHLLQQVKLYREALTGDPICGHLQRNTVSKGSLFTQAYATLKKAEVELLRYTP